MVLELFASSRPFLQHRDTMASWQLFGLLSQHHQKSDQLVLLHDLDVNLGSMADYYDIRHCYYHAIETPT